MVEHKYAGVQPFCINLLQPSYTYTVQASIWKLSGAKAFVKRHRKGEAVCKHTVCIHVTHNFRMCSGEGARLYIKGQQTPHICT